ncbi:phosphomannomutase [Pseudoruegeria sp. HB172150]|uniref:phosphomannomutase n=1 Tax=Pseudoruegeria sp. HB172150 TaxID=2721164 RepID=UPI0015535D86|nr:phosphomannomutase [Pseudoruegeria sp. HB172150]
MTELTCFKTYDIRGQVGENLDEDIAYRIGRAFARVMKPGKAVTGRDIRDSSPRLQAALSRGLADEGVDVLDIGLCGTEEVYFATDHYGAGGGLMVTASHNPIGDNGVKLIGPGATPISRESGLQAMHDMAAANEFGDPVARPGTITPSDPRAAYVQRVLSFVETDKLGTFNILVNAGNGAAGPTFDAIEQALTEKCGSLTFMKLHHTPDGTFPNGIPNPLLPENRPMTGDAVKAARAGLGVAWDGDFDRCFLFDENGDFIDGEYIVGLLAAAILAQSPGEKIVHDPRVMWNTQRVVKEAGGEAVVSKTGHALIKATMREVDAAYGGEMSAHHYFRDFMYCDSGMIPWLLVLAHMSDTGKKLSELVEEMRARHPSSGEINFRLSDPESAVATVEDTFAQGGEIDRLDGLSVAYKDWRFNLRKSNTEPVVRLNVETLGDAALLREKTDAISKKLSKYN